MNYRGKDKNSLWLVFDTAKYKKEEIYDDNALSAHSYPGEYKC